jgi:hypothetical protein
MAQERKDLDTSRLYLNLAYECFNKAAVTEQTDAADVFTRMGRRYMSEAMIFEAAEKQGPKQPRIT